MAKKEIFIDLDDDVIFSNSESDLENFYKKIKAESEGSGYFINPDIETTLMLIDGLLVNQKRYGYLGCPCRLSAKDKSKDLDIICPCNYRDDDVSEFGSCYCALYVSKEISLGLKDATSVPERRAPSGYLESKVDLLSEKSEEVENRIESIESIESKFIQFSDLKYPIYRCQVCGYLCAKDLPPAICPICKADKERFERFI